MKQHLLVLAFASFCIVANAQKVLFNQLNDGLYNSRIKLVDEFFDRFNGKEGHPGIAKNDKNYRKKNLTLVFNGKIFKSKDDAKFKEAQNLIDSVIAKNIHINYPDSTWFAKTICHGLRQTGRLRLRALRCSLRTPSGELRGRLK